MFRFHPVIEGTLAGCLHTWATAWRVAAPSVPVAVFARQCGFAARALAAEQVAAAEWRAKQAFQVGRGLANG